MDSPSNVDVEVVAIGGPAVIHGSVKIEGRSVTVEGLVLDKPQVGASAIELRASDAIVIRGLAVLNALARDPDQEAIVELTSIGKGTTVSIERLWLVGNRLDSGGSLVTLATTGAGQLESATVSQSVFAGNRGGSGIATMFTRKVTIDRVAVIEPSLGKPWLDVRSPITQISLSNSTVATAKLARQSPSADSKPEDFPKIATAKVDLRGPSKKEHVDPSGATFGKAIKPPADWAFVTEPARKLEAPDIAKLTADL